MLIPQLRSTGLALFRNFARGGGGVSRGEEGREKGKPSFRPKCKAPEALRSTDYATEQTFLENKKNVLRVSIVVGRRASDITFTLSQTETFFFN